MKRQRKQEKYFLEAKVVIDNSLMDSLILEKVNNYGFPKQRVEEGRNLHEEAYNLHKRQQKEKAQSDEANRKYREAHEKMDKKFSEAVEFARRAFKNDRASLIELGIKGPRQRTIPGMISQADLFYSHALTNENIKSKLSVCGLPNNKLVEGQTMLNELINLHKLKEREKGEAQMATVDKYDAMDNFDSWYDIYRSVLKRALAGNPQLIEKLGITDRS